MMNLIYQNFDLELSSAGLDEETGEQLFRATVNSQHGEPSTLFPFPLQAEEWRRFQIQSAYNVRAVHLVQASTPSTPLLSTEELGTRLFQALFEQENMFTILQQDLEDAHDAGKSLRIRLRFGEDVAELAELPWEYLYHPQQGFFALSRQTPIVRYIKLDYARKTKPVVPPLRILPVIANPNDPKIPALDVEREWQHLTQALDPMDDQLQIHLDPNPVATLSAIRERLQDDQVHVIHFIGHGYFDEEQKIGGLVLEDEHGNAHYVNADDLCDLLRDQKQLRLLFLNACNSAQSDRDDAFAGTAQRLVKQGLPIVLAMQQQITDGAAIQLARQFYQSIAAGYPVDVGITMARKEIHLLGNQHEWSTPVLFSRLDDNQLVAATPERVLVETMYGQQGNLFSLQDGSFLPLPVDVVHTQTREQIRPLMQMEANLTAGTEFLKTICTLFGSTTKFGSTANRTDKEDAQIVILEGGYGSNKTIQLQRLLTHTLHSEYHSEYHREESSEYQGNDTTAVLPLYIDFKSDIKYLGGHAVNSIDDLITIIRAKINADGHLVEQQEIEFFLKRRNFRLRLLFDHISVVASWDRTDLITQIINLAKEYPHNDYLVAAIPGAIDPNLWTEINLQLLLAQPLFPWRIRHFLQSLPAVGEELLQHLNNTELIDLAATPSVLVKLIRDFEQMSSHRAKQIHCSRSATMERLLHDNIVQIPSDQGMRAHAESFILQLAWSMQWARKPTWSVNKAFDLMHTIRGKRGYRLEDFYSALQEAHLLTNMGHEQLSFSQTQMQAYCSARALLRRSDRATVLEDILATLGRPSRLRWWEDTLVFLCGLLVKRKRRAELGRLLQDLVYGTNLLHSDQTFLAARCLLEAHRQGYRRSLGEELAYQLVEALVWRLYNRNEADVVKRTKAVRLLGQLAGRFPKTEAAHYLVRIAYERIHVDRSGQAAYDRSNIRMVAASALLRLDYKQRRPLYPEDSTLATLFDGWLERKTVELISLLNGKDVGVQGLAAMALGDLHGYFTAASYVEASHANEAKRALRVLLEAFNGLETMPEPTRWAVAHALIHLDDPDAITRVIDKFLAQSSKRKTPPKKQAAQYRCVAYLIGRLRLQDPKYHDFLIDNCLKHSTDPQLWRITIESLGWLADPQDRKLLEEIAIGSYDIFETDLQRKHRQTAKAAVKELLQQYAVTALATVGNRDTIDELRKHLSSKTDQPLTWHTGYKLAYFETSEQIHWRMQHNAE